MQLYMVSGKMFTLLMFSYAYYWVFLYSMYCQKASMDVCSNLSTVKTNTELSCVEILISEHHIYVSKYYNNKKNIFELDGK